MITKCLGLVSASSKMENYCSHLHYYIVQLMEVTILLCASTAWTSSSSVANKMLFLKWSERSKGFFFFFIAGNFYFILISFSHLFPVNFYCTRISLGFTYFSCAIFYGKHMKCEIFVGVSLHYWFFVISMCFKFLMYFIAQQAA